MSHRTICRVFSWILFALLASASLRAQTPTEVNAPLPTIADEPKTIDPVEVLPEQLAAGATHDFSDSSLREVVDWLRDEQRLVVLLDKKALAEIGVIEAEPISDRLTQAPLYLLLNRLRSLGLDWYYDDEIVYITSREVAEERATTLTYNVGELLDEDFDLDRLQDVITSTIAPNTWEHVGGEGVVNALGDVLFVRQSADVHREVKALLQSLEKPARRTFLNDPRQHLRLRDALEENISVDFEDTPLESAIQQLAELADIDIRLDVSALRNARIREREPVTLKLEDRSLETVLQAAVLDLDLTWIIRNGCLWVTSKDEAENYLKTAVYDVRDLCRDADESDSLMLAITSQAEPASWDNVGGEGSIEYAKPGVLVIGHRERVHNKVLELLETYRSALRSSKQRERRGEDPDEEIVVYYRLHANVARDLATMLPVLVQPDAWKTPEGEKAGTIHVMASVPDISPVAIKGAKGDGEGLANLITDRAVLIVKQTRAVQDEIAKIIVRVEAGDARSAEEMGGGMGGGGGFGGGFFSIESESDGLHVK